MRLIRYQPEHQKPMLALHRSTVEEFTLGMSQQQDEADLVAIDEDQETGRSFYGAVETVQFSKTLDEKVCESAA